MQSVEVFDESDDGVLPVPLFAKGLNLTIKDLLVWLRE
jgi:hypothetical protein